MNAFFKKNGPKWGKMCLLDRGNYKWDLVYWTNRANFSILKSITLKKYLNRIRTKNHFTSEICYFKYPKKPSQMAVFTRNFLR